MGTCQGCCQLLRSQPQQGSKAFPQASARDSKSFRKQMDMPGLLQKSFNLNTGAALMLTGCHEEVLRPPPPTSQRSVVSLIEEQGHPIEPCKAARLWLCAGQGLQQTASAALHHMVSKQRCESRGSHRGWMAADSSALQGTRCLQCAAANRDITWFRPSVQPMSNEAKHGRHVRRKTCHH